MPCFADNRYGYYDKRVCSDHGGVGHGHESCTVALDRERMGIYYDSYKRSYSHKEVKELVINAGSRVTCRRKGEGEGFLFSWSVDGKKVGEITTSKFSEKDLRPAISCR